MVPQELGVFLMSSAVMFIVATVLVAIFLTLLVFGGSAMKAWRYFRHDSEGRSVFKGIVLFILFGVGLTAFSLFASPAEAEEPKGEWFAYGEVFLGIDYTKKLSPQCHEGGPNDRVTSNGGIRVNIYQSADERFELNSKYTHHSCAFSPDREQYDALGVELTYRLW